MTIEYDDITFGVFGEDVAFTQSTYTVGVYGQSFLLLQDEFFVEIEVISGQDLIAAVMDGNLRKFKPIIKKSETHFL
jgi:hypothetical protein